MLGGSEKAVDIELTSSGAEAGAAVPASARDEAEVVQAPARASSSMRYETLRTYERAPALSILRSSPCLLHEFYASSTRYYMAKPWLFGRELLAGVIVAVMQLPESVAFSYVAGVPPSVGLFSSVILGAVAGLGGGKAAMISGCAGALAVIAADMTSNSGSLGHLDMNSRVQHLFTAMTVCGCIQILVGVLGLARFARLIPATAMVGFMNGLAIVIFMAQLTAFQACDGRELFYDCTPEERVWLQLDEGRTWTTVGIALTCTAIMFAWPMVPRVGKVIPAPLVAVVVGAVFEHFINRPFIKAPTRLISETAPISGSLPTFSIPWAPLQNAEIGEIFRFGAVFAAIGLIESVMTLQAINELTNTVPTEFAVSQECVAQGVGNLLSSFLGGMGGDTMIGQSTVNIRSGARGRVSSVTAAIVLLLIVVIASSVVNLVPVAALTGVLFAIVISTFNWNTFRVLFRIPRTEAFTIILVTVLAVIMDLAVAVLAGVAVAAIASSWNTARLVQISSHYLPESASGSDVRVKVYTVKGALFFASTRSLVEQFDPVDDPEHVYLDLRGSVISDFSAIDAVHTIGRKYKEAGKHLHVVRLCPRSMRRFGKHGAQDVASLHADGPAGGDAGLPGPLDYMSISKLHVFGIPEAITEDDAEAAFEDDDDVDVAGDEEVADVTARTTTE